MEPVKFDQFKHGTPAEGVCVMEYISVLAGGEFTDWPDCTHPLLAKLAHKANDTLGDDERTPTLAPLVPRLMGTNTNDLDACRAILEAIGAHQTVARLDFWVRKGWFGTARTEPYRTVAYVMENDLRYPEAPWTDLLIKALDALDAYNTVKNWTADLDAQWSAWAGRVLETVP